MSSVEDDEVDSEIQMFQNALEFLRGEDIMSLGKLSSWLLNCLTSIAELKELFIETIS
jgi:hypothetical protein